MGIKIGNTNIVDINVGRDDIKEVYAGTHLVWSKTTGNSYWVDDEGVRHHFAPSNTPLNNFCTDEGIMVINGENVGKQEPVSITFDNDYFVDENVGDYFLYQCTNLRTVVFPNTVSGLLSIGSHFLGLSGITTLDLTGFASKGPLVVGDYFCERCNELSVIITESINYTSDWLVNDEGTCLYHDDVTYPRFDLMGEDVGVGSFKILFPERVEDEFVREYSIACTFTMTDGKVIYFATASCPPASWAQPSTDPNPNVVVGGKKYRKKDILSIDFVDRGYLSGQQSPFWMCHTEKTLFGSQIGWQNLTSITQSDTLGDYILSDNSLGDYTQNEIMFPQLAFVGLTGCKATGDSCFKHMTHVTSLSLPQLAIIGNECFQDIGGEINQLVLPSLTTIGDYCFRNLSTVQTINLPSLMTMGSECFLEAPLLTELSMPTLNIIDSHCIIELPELQSIDAPNLTTAGNRCLRGLPKLEEVNFPALTSVGEGFLTATAIHELSLPNLTSITSGNNFCTRCQNLSSISLPKITDISGMIASRLPALAVFNAPLVSEFPSAVFIDSPIESLTADTNLYLASIKNSALAHCTSISVINLPNLLGIEQGCFRDSALLLNTFVANNLGDIGHSSFKFVNALAHLSLPSLISLGHDCFNGCQPDHPVTSPELVSSTTSMITLNLPNLMRMKQNCFNCVGNLESVELDHVSVIEPCCFNGLSKLNHFYAPYLSSIGMGCFGLWRSSDTDPINVSINFDSPYLVRVDNGCFWNEFALSSDSVDIYFQRESRINFVGKVGYIKPGIDGKYRVHVKAINEEAAINYFEGWTIMIIP